MTALTKRGKPRRRVAPGGSLADHLALYTAVQPNGCWVWTSAVDPTGYGILSHDKRTMKAHRASYLARHGSIPAGAHLDHTCHNGDTKCQGGSGCQHRRCINPDHLQPVTCAENVRRSHAHNGARTHCPQGHAYDEANTRHYRGRRYCIACMNARNAARIPGYRRAA